MGTGPSATGPPGAIRSSTQLTVASVGPYELNTVTCGCRSRQARRAPARSASPPITIATPGPAPSGRDSSRGRGPGVTLRNGVAVVASSGSTRTDPPLVNGGYRLVTVASKAMVACRSVEPPAAGRATAG